MRILRRGSRGAVPAGSGPSVAWRVRTGTSSDFVEPRAQAERARGPLEAERLSTSWTRRKTGCVVEARAAVRRPARDSGRRSEAGARDGAEEGLRDARRERRSGRREVGEVREEGEVLVGLLPEAEAGFQEIFSGGIPEEIASGPGLRENRRHSRATSRKEDSSKVVEGVPGSG